MAHITGSAKRKMRVRSKLKKVGGDRIRLSVFRASKHIYAQVIDGEKTVAQASTIDKDYKGKKTTDCEAATTVGKAVAERAIKAGVKEVVFDRGSYPYHGRVKALAEAAREAGLSF